MSDILDDIFGFDEEDYEEPTKEDVSNDTAEDNNGILYEEEVIDLSLIHI